MEFKKKLASLIALVGLFIFSGVVIFQLQVAFGWTNPTIAPPGGSGVLTAVTTGGISRLGINTAAPITADLVITSTPGTPGIDVDPSGAAGGRIIGLTANPVNNDDAASKAYVNSVLGAGGGGKPVVTVYGISGANLPWSNFTNGLTTFKNCLLGVGHWCTPTTWTLPGAGSGTAICPVGWSSIYAGYGPYAYQFRTYFYKAAPGTMGGLMRAGDDQSSAPDGDQVAIQHWPGQASGISYSICGKGWYELAQTDYSLLDGSGANTGSGDVSGIVSACVWKSNSEMVCNTCNICQQD
jgi:hypothetical protein